MSDAVVLKLNKKFLINLLLLAVVILAMVEFVELAVIVYAWRTGALCK
jgi:hypothetical protein